MPITDGHGNPDWTRDETVLALDLLYKHGKPIDRRHSDVIALSTILQNANIHPASNRRASFRNADGVALKLQNLFSAVEPGRGLSFSKTDLAVVNDFPKERSEYLSEIASALKNTVSLGVPDPDLSDEETFIEGGWLTSRHRQRDRRLRSRLLNQRKGEALVCEICDYSVSTLGRDLQESMFEAHHRIPLVDAEGERLTRVTDMALLCACCHRLIHRLISRQAQWVGVDEAREILFASLNMNKDGRTSHRLAHN
ncbi:MULTISPECIES: HNH endonuclease [unclassified Rhizobium]|uniref:HNH endonuclease n=1 Tax=unclassified Rhizobium TaxID=2613769 RepID=UPI0007E9E6C6|nr:MULTISPECIES: HNH endonuclease [unclassified Rhizobium]ANK87410.1 HNH endonuclease protein [Rhizobium sp. N731]ANL17656.1 HNH endonuclease protein [Rhizobium sp. N1314]